MVRTAGDVPTGARSSRAPSISDWKKLQLLDRAISKLDRQITHATWMQIVPKWDVKRVGKLRDLRSKYDSERKAFRVKIKSKGGWT